MARLIHRTGRVAGVRRGRTSCGGVAGEPVTTFDLDGLGVRYSGATSVGAGDVVTVVGTESNGSFRALALRNEATDVSYAPRTVAWLASAVVLLGAVAPWVGFPWALVVAPAGGLCLRVALERHRARLVLDALPSRHASPFTGTHAATGRGSPG